MSENGKSVAVDWLNGGGEMGKLIRSKDWSKTPLGPIESWSQSLRTTVSLCLASNFPINIIWGPGRVQIYNDGYWPICGNKHPYSMGQDAKECWLSAWDVLREPFERATAGETAFLENRRMFLDRNGYLEETFFTFSFSPIRDETGGVGGLFLPVTEMTQQILTERRLQVLRDLANRTADAKTIEETCRSIAQALAAHELDLPFTLLYRLDTDGKRADLMSMTGLEPGSAAARAIVDLQASPEWALAEVAQWTGTVRGSSGQTRQIDDLEQRFGSLKCSPYPESPKSAIVMPIALPGLAHPWGVFIAGVSPRRALDEAYQTFYTLLGKSVTTAIVNAHVYEEECKRAEALAELDRAKTTFFSNVSHEFRTPLTLILGPAEDALTDRDDPLSPHQRQHLEVIQRNGLRLLKLVNTLLDFSRLESDRLQTVYEPTDLATFTAELASVFRSAIEKANLRLAIDCPPLPDPVYVDREMWEKIVLNLLSNAFKFTFKGEIKVSLKIKYGQESFEEDSIQNSKLKTQNSKLKTQNSKLKTQNFIELVVQDTGIGIPASEIPRLFERFYRVKGAKGRTFEGSGIGLSLVQELVKLHGGTVGVSSVEGEGSCFKVLIPTGCTHLPTDRIGATRTITSTAMRASPASPYVEEALQWLPAEGGSVELGMLSVELKESDTLSSSSTQNSKLKTQNSQTARILLVDDNADMRDYVQRLLSDRWQVDTAANGALALNLIQQQLPDLVLTDVMMPEVDGFQLLAALRADPATKSLPIILLSARAGEEATISGLEAGADDYLIKPFSARELIARVETQLQMSRLRSEQSANRFKNQFLMTVTHELQAPLVAILGWSRLLQTKSFNSSTLARALSTIERNATIEAKLVKDLLDVSSILSGKLHLKSQLVDLVSLVQNVVTSFRQAAGAKTIQLVETRSDDALGNVLADGDRLRQILANLLDNAIKFTPQGGQVEVRLESYECSVLSCELENSTQNSLRETQNSQSFAQITVTDTGIGIAADFLPFVFDRFTQAEVPSRHSPGGVGIGLAIARHLVELHHGTIEVASEGEGRGAAFTVKLPLV